MTLVAPTVKHTINGCKVVMPSCIYSVFLVLGSMFFFSSCNNSMEEVNQVVSRANVKIERGKDVVINYSDNGVVRIQAMGPTATRFNTENPYLDFSDGFKILFYNDALDCLARLANSRFRSGS